MSPCQKSAIRRLTVKAAYCPKTVTISKSVEELAREVALVQGQSGGREEDSETDDRKRAIACANVSTGGLWTATPPIAHAGR